MTIEEARLRTASKKVEDASKALAGAIKEADQADAHVSNLRGHYNAACREFYDVADEYLPQDLRENVRMHGSRLTTGPAKDRDVRT